MLLLPFKKLRFRKPLRLFLPVGEERVAGRGGDAALDVMLSGFGLSRAWSCFCGTDRRGPLGCRGWFLQDTGPGNPGTSLKSGMARVQGWGDWYPGMEVIETQGCGDWGTGMEVIGTQGWR